MPRDPNRRISTTVYLDPDQLEQLDEIARKTQRTKAVIMRYGIDLALKHYEKELKGDKK